MPRTENNKEPFLLFSVGPSLLLLLFPVEPYRQLAPAGIWWYPCPVKNVFDTGVLMVKSIVSIGLFSLLLCAVAHAHRPIFSDQAATDPNTAVLIAQPAISQVIYREITDEAKQIWIAFDANEGFELFIQIGVPVLDRLKDFRPAMLIVGPGLPDESPPFTLPEGTGATAFSTTDIKEPRFFHEHFTGTGSWILRSETVALPKSGRYYVVAYVPSGENGKLWLSVGQQESFGVAEWSQFKEWKKKIRKFHEVSEEGGLGYQFLVRSETC